MTCLDGDNVMLYKEQINLPMTLNSREWSELEPNWSKYDRPSFERIEIILSSISVNNQFQIPSSMMCLGGDNGMLYEEPINLHLTHN